LHHERYQSFHFFQLLLFLVFNFYVIGLGSGTLWHLFIVALAWFAVLGWWNRLSLTFVFEFNALQRVSQGEENKFDKTLETQNLPPP